MLERYFSAQHFWVAEPGLSQQALFERVCGQLREEGYVDADFLPSVREREDILSTMLGDGIALPHSLGLLARKTTVCTIIAPHGVAWGEGGVARVIFLLAISKTEYEEAMAIYELFVSFMRQRAGARLVESRSFEQFLRNALSCLPEV
jgi:mannitol/fructose-specific phosphotransferase system IIA component